MEIAGVGFSIRGKKQISSKAADPVYNPFYINNAQGNKPADISVMLEYGNLPDTDKFEKIFESNQAWNMYAGTAGYFISLHPSSFSEPIWIAETNRDFSKVTVFCSDKMIETGNKKTCISNPVNYPLDQILLMHFFAARKGVLVHSAGAQIDGKGCIFPGKSGAGKSTLSNQLALAGCSGLLSDDRMIIKKAEREYMAYGTPWPGEAGIAENKETPLSGIFFIKHGDDNIIKAISPKEAIERFFPVTSIPWYDKEMMQSVLTILEDLCFNIPSYEFSFKPHPDAADTLRQFVSKQ